MAPAGEHQQQVPAANLVRTILQRREHPRVLDPLKHILREHRSPWIAAAQQVGRPLHPLAQPRDVLLRVGEDRPRVAVLLAAQQRQQQHLRRDLIVAPARGLGDRSLQHRSTGGVQPTDDVLRLDAHTDLEDRANTTRGRAAAPLVHVRSRTCSSCPRTRRPTARRPSGSCDRRSARSPAAAPSRPPGRSRSGSDARSRRRAPP